MIAGPKAELAEVPPAPTNHLAPVEALVAKLIPKELSLVKVGRPCVINKDPAALLSAGMPHWLIVPNILLVLLCTGTVVPVPVFPPVIPST
jgi:hypothetical protein